MLTYQGNAVAMDSLFSMCYILSKINFDYWEAYHQISPKPKIEQALMLLTSDIPSYDLPLLNVKIPEKPLSRRLMDKDTGPIYDQLKTH